MALMARFASSLVDAGPIVFQPCTRLPGEKARTRRRYSRSESAVLYSSSPNDCLFVCHCESFSIFIIFQIRAILLLVLFVSITG